MAEQTENLPRVWDGHAWVPVIIPGPPPDWADLREMARNAGWTRDRGESGTTWGHFAFGAILDRSYGMAYVNKGNRRIYLAGPGGDEHRTVVLYDPTPAEIITAARLVGLGGAS